MGAELKGFITALQDPLLIVNRDISILHKDTIYVATELGVERYFQGSYLGTYFEL
jgi:hypothetical protein